MSGVIVAKTFGREAEQLREFQDTNTRLTNVSIRQYMTGRGFFIVVQAFFTMAPAFIWLVGGILILDGSDRVTLGDIVAFSTIQARLLFPMANLLLRGVEIHGSLALFERIFEYMDIKPTIVDPIEPTHIDPRTAKGEVVFDRVSFTYQASELERLEAKLQAQVPQRRSDGFGGGQNGPPSSDGQMGSELTMPAAMSSRDGRDNGRSQQTPSNAATVDNGQESDDQPFSLSDISFTAGARNSLH